MAEIKKIQPMGDSTQYTINADKVDDYHIDDIVARKSWNPSSDLDLVKLQVGMYDHTSNMNSTLPVSYGTVLNIHGQYKYGALIEAGTDNFLYYRAYYYNNDEDYLFRGAWQKLPTSTGGGASGTWGISITGNAATAIALTSSAGSSTVPIYFSSGKPVQCSTTLGVSITGNAATATKIAYPAQLTTDDAINAFNEGNKFQVATWNSTSSPGVSNGILISTGWTGTSYGAQIAIDDDPTWYIALRQRNGDGWKAWKRIPMGDGTGASGTWGISITGSSASCTGNAATATKVGDSSCWGYFHNNNELNFGGTGAGTNIYIGYRAMDSKPIPTNVIFGGSSGSSNIKCNNVMSNATVSSTHSTYGACISMWSDSEGGNIFWRCAGSGGSASNTGYQIDTCSNVLRLYRTTNGGAAATHGATLMDSNGYASFPRVYGAVWNDYAEFRQTKDKIEPGRCIKEIGDDTLELTSERLQAGCEIVSDTYGFGIGETEKCKTPTAASGRVLAYPYEDRELLRQHIGEPVCSGPNGTVSLMTHEEAKNYPWLIIGTISAIPDYKEWEAGYKGDHIVKVNGRIWIRIR